MLFTVSRDQILQFLLSSVLILILMFTTLCRYISDQMYQLLCNVVSVLILLLVLVEQVDDWNQRLEQSVRKWAAQIVLALEHLHSQDVICR